MKPVDGPVLGPFNMRSQALAAERRWLEKHWLPQTEGSRHHHLPILAGKTISTNPTPGQAIACSGFFYGVIMTQKELEREIANQTGETIQTIKSMGFSPLREVIPVEERQEPLVVDWDEVDRNRYSRGTF